MTLTQIGRAPLVVAPTPAGRNSELLDVADVREGLAWIDPQDMFVSWNCIDVENVPEICVGDTTPQKTFAGPTLVDGWRFAIYLGGQCKPLSADVESDIDRVFDLRESRGVEKVFEAIILGSGAVVAGTPVSAAHALALMENALGDSYAGIGTLHMSPLIATLLLQDQLIYDVGGKFYTHLGTKVVVGTGYSSTTLYGTGDVTIYRGAKVGGPAPDMANNVANILVERPYVVVADCGALKITGIPQVPGTQSSPGGPVTPAPNLITGTAAVDGPGGSWTPPSTGNLRSVTVIVTSGSVEVDGTEITAPNDATFDADTAEELTAPTVTASSSGDRAVVAWVIAP